MKRILLLHGPNLNLLGTRQPEIYGTDTLADIERRVTRWAGRLGLEVDTFQSNHEGAMIDRLQAARTEVDGVVLNAGALTHSSYALADAITAVALPAVEVHISNILTRELWRRRSVTAPSCVYAVFGRGVDGYRDALRVLVRRVAWPAATVRYGDHDDQIVDLRVPGGDGPWPAAVLIHGGFWRSQWTRDTIDGLAVDLADRGWLTASVEYRRLDTGGGWPTTGEDVLEAVRVVASRPEVAAGSTVLVGHSAGGQLALWAAARTATPLAGVMALAPVADLAEASRLRLGDGVVDRFLGGDPATVPETYRQASPAEEPPTRPPQVVLHGGADDVVPVEISRRYVAAAVAAGADVTLLDPGDVDHDQVVDAEHPAWAEAWAALTGRIDAATPEG